MTNEKWQKISLNFILILFSHPFTSMFSHHSLSSFNFYLIYDHGLFIPLYRLFFSYNIQLYILNVPGLLYWNLSNLGPI